MTFCYLQYVHSCNGWLYCCQSPITSCLAICVSFLNVINDADVVQWQPDMSVLTINPSNMWKAFLTNMVPEIHRLVQFCKKLPGDLPCNGICMFVHFVLLVCMACFDDGLPDGFPFRRNDIACDKFDWIMRTVRTMNKINALHDDYGQMEHRGFNQRG